MEDWTKWTDDQVFGDASESPGSQAAYWRETEIKRRLYLLEREALAAQVASIAEQREATKAQREVIAEMRKQSQFLLASVVIALLAAMVGLASVFF